MTEQDVFIPMQKTILTKTINKQKKNKKKTKLKKIIVFLLIGKNFYQKNIEMKAFKDKKIWHHKKVQILILILK